MTRLKFAVGRHGASLSVDNSALMNASGNPVATKDRLQLGAESRHYRCSALAVLAGAGSSCAGAGSETHPSEWEDRVITFLDRNLVRGN